MIKTTQNKELLTFPMTRTSLTEETFNITLSPASSFNESLEGSVSGGPSAPHGCMLLDHEFDPQHNPENTISEQMEFWITLVNSAILMPLLTVVGVPGNVLCAAVFYKLGLKERINLCLFYLAIVDLLNVIVSVCLSYEVQYVALVGPSSFFIENFVGLTGFTWVSMFLSAIIATERCFCVVSPLRAQRVLSTRTMAVFITITSLVLLAGMLVIAGPKHTMACVFDPETNITSQIVYVTSYYMDNKEVLDALEVFVYAIALPSIFLLIIFTTTSATAIKLHSSVKWRNKNSSACPVTRMSNKEAREVALTKMLIWSSVLFMVCLIPMICVQIAMFLLPELNHGGRYHNLTAVLWRIIPVINSSFNFVIYYYMGTRFKKTLKELLCCGGTKSKVRRAKGEREKCSVNFIS